MNIPGFYAESSLSKSTQKYNGVSSNGQMLNVQNGVFPALRSFGRKFGRRGGLWEQPCFPGQYVCCTATRDTGNSTECIAWGCCSWPGEETILV